PGGAPGRGPPAAQSTTKLTRRLTRHSVTSPPSPQTTLISFTQAPLMFLTDSDALARPCLTASSMLLGEEALSSMTLATDMMSSLDSERLRPGGWNVPACPGFCKGGAKGHDTSCRC